MSLKFENTNWSCRQLKHGILYIMFRVQNNKYSYIQLKDQQCMHLLCAENLQNKKTTTPKQRKQKQQPTPSTYYSKALHNLPFNQGELDVHCLRQERGINVKLTPNMSVIYVKYCSNSISKLYKNMHYIRNGSGAL